MEFEFKAPLGRPREGWEERRIERGREVAWTGTPRFMTDQILFSDKCVVDIKTVFKRILYNCTAFYYHAM